MNRSNFVEIFVFELFVMGMYCYRVSGVRRMLKKFSGVLAIALVLSSCAAYEQGKLIDIEDSNAYIWQKYMSEQEFNQLEEGMSYLDVVNTAKGIGTLQKEGIYIWQDEDRLTQAYEIHFQNDRLVEKKVLELRGHSTR